MKIEIDVEFDRRGAKVSDEGAKGFLEIMRFEHEGFQKLVLENQAASPKSVKFLKKHFDYLPQAAKDEIAAAYPEVTRALDTPENRAERRNSVILFTISVLVIFWFLSSFIL